jgi:hypothetical protein
MDITRLLAITLYRAFDIDADGRILAGPPPWMSWSHWSANRASSTPWPTCGPARSAT